MPVVTSKAKVTSQINFTELSFLSKYPLFPRDIPERDTRTIEIGDPDEVKKIQNGTRREQYISI